MRRQHKGRKELLPDPRYGNVLVSRFINNLMHGGKKSVARKVMYDALEQVKKSQKGEDPVAIFNTAVSNVGPMLEVKSRRIGGATYQVPVEVRGERRIALAMRWLIQAVRSKKGSSMAMRLAEEFTLASKNEGSAIKKKQDTHRMAEANKAFAHFAW